MKLVYIAAPWVDKALMDPIARKLETKGYVVTHKWWLTEDLGPKAEGGHQDHELRAQAYADREGVLNAETLILINTSKSEGKAVEQGIALASGIPIIAIGKRGDGTSSN